MLKAERLNAIAILRRASGLVEVHRTTNIISNDGDIYYAQKASGGTATNAFNAVHLGTGTTTPAKADTSSSATLIVGSGKAVTSTYPKANDSDANNTGKGTKVVTWKFDYTTADGALSSIAEAIICVGTGEPSAASPILTHFLFGATFSKLSTDTLTIFVNHAAAGV